LGRFGIERGDSPASGFGCLGADLLPAGGVSEPVGFRASAGSAGGYGRCGIDSGFGTSCWPALKDFPGHSVLVGGANVMPMPSVTSRITESPAETGRQGDDGLEMLQRWAAHGEAEVFARIVHQYAGCVYATCLRVLGDSGRAEEVSQETFFRLMRRPSEVTQNLGGWLHR